MRTRLARELALLEEDPANRRGADARGSSVEATHRVVDPLRVGGRNAYKGHASHRCGCWDNAPRPSGEITAPLTTVKSTAVCREVWSASVRRSGKDFFWPSHNQPLSESRP